MNSQHIRNHTLDLGRFAIAALLALLAALAVCATPTARANAAEPTPISTAEELKGITTGSSDVSYVLTADIDLGGAEWTPIGYPSNFNDGNDKGFKGTFDGNGHTVKNFKIPSFFVGKNNSIQYAGFFGCTKGATIKDLTLENVEISGSYSGGASHDLMVGSLVGLAVNTNISGCNVINATVVDMFSENRSDSSNYAIGGLVGDFYVDGTNKVTLSNCSASNASVSAGATFSGNVNSTQAFTGGMVGRLRERGTSEASVANCMFDGKVYGAGYVGPFVGGARSGESSPTAAGISALAAERAKGSCYSGTFSGPEGSPNKAYNCGAGVWDDAWNYLLAKYQVNDQNRAQALEFLNQNAGSENTWRAAALGSSTALVLDHRGASIVASYASGQATLSAALTGYYSAADKIATRVAWKVDGSDAGSSSSITTPITSKAQTVELRLLDDGIELASDSATIEAAQLEFALTKAFDTNGDIESLTVILKSASEGFTADDFTYTWYGVNDNGETDLKVSDRTLVKKQFGTFENFRIVATSNASKDLSVEFTANTSGRTVYLSTNGNDSNSGFVPEQPVATFQKAYTLLDKNAPRENNVIVVMDKYTNTEFGYDSTTFNKPATITSYDVDNNVDYRGTKNAYISFYSSNTTKHPGDDGGRVAGKLLFADTTFKDITLSAHGAPNSWNVGYIFCQGHSLTMDTGVRMEDYRDMSALVQNRYGLLSGSKTSDFHIVGGYANYNEAPTVGYPEERGTCEIVIKSGSYARVIAGGRNFESPGNKKSAVNPVSYNQFATEQNPFNVAITVDIAQDQSQMATNKFNCDIGLLTGGQTDGTIYSNSTITLKNGVVPLVFGSSIGYNRNVNSNGTAYPNNDFIGTVQVNMEGGSVTQLYGGCLGRTAPDEKAEEKVDARFRSSKYTLEGQPDIAINISGGSIGKIGSIGGGNALTGVFAAGAGGITGEGNPETGQVTNKVDIAVNISGDASITGNLYGGGYGQSPAVTDASLACLEAGNLYGSSTMTITGGTINADVYGGGAGTAEYLAKNASMNKLAQIVGDVKLSISNAQINGSVYGGSQGVVQKSYDCTTMAKITGNVNLSLENAHVTGGVYGGSALGTVTGDVTTALKGSGSSVDGSVYGAGKGEFVSEYNIDQQKTVGQVGGNATLSIEGYSVAGSVFGGGSVGAVLGSTSVQLDGATVAGSAYAAGEGAYLGEDNSDVALQKAIGWVRGDAAITLTGGASVTDNVFGGGNLGVVGDGSLATGSVPYSIADPVNVTVRVENAIVGKSVFGGGAGDAKTAGQMPRLLGALFGTASVTVHEGTIEADVFGGGDQSYTYAPLDNEGHPECAATVIVNGGDSLHVHADDGRVADGTGDGVREVDAPANANADRVINLGGSVFGGGNIAEVHTVSANSYTVYGDTEVFVKGAGVNFTDSVRGGVYGDGHLSRAYGKRTVTLVGLRTKQDDGTWAGKSFFSLQRANRAVVHDCSIYLRGAKDLVNESDKTPYSLNRVDDLNVYANSTIQFDTVVNGLGNLYSDVLPERTFTSTSDWNGEKLATTKHGDNVTQDERMSYRTFAQGATSWTDAAGDQHTSTNTIIINNGKWLDVKQPADEGDASYGAVTGLFSLISSNAQDGGAFVFGRFSSQDSTGTFISLNRASAETDAGFLELYTQDTKDIDGKACRIWFVRGDSYTYERDVRAYTTSSKASVQVWLPVEGGQSKNMDIAKEGISITGGLDDMRQSASDPGPGRYTAEMVVGGSEEILFYSGKSDWSGYGFSSYVPNDGPGLMPATITVDLSNIGDNQELEEQKGTVEFTLLANNGAQQYHFKIDIILERAYAVASEKAHYGRVYDNIAVENTTPITPTSAYTTQFTTTYSPGAYRSAVEAQLSAYTTKAVHGDDHKSTFPKGTQITMVNITNPAKPTYYYYKCGKETDTILLTDFESMSNNSHYANPTGNTIIVEDLLFVVDYGQANGGSGQGAGTTYLALNHTYGTNGADILRYSYKDDNDKPAERYNNLWNAYEVSSVKDKRSDPKDRVYLDAQLQNPSNAASPEVEVGHTDNFMYDTYTTKLVLTKDTSCVSTLFDENDVMLQVSLTEGNDQFGKAFPLGSRLVVKHGDTVVSTRYFHEDDQPRGFIMADLGNKLEKEYTIELQVSRYLSDGALETVFGKGSSQYNFKVELFVSSDGLARSTDGAFKTLEAKFDAARKPDVDPPSYDLGKGNKDLLRVHKGEVTGEIKLKKQDNVNGDAEMMVLRRPSDGSGELVDITTDGGKVASEDQGGSGHIKFTVTDSPGKGTYEYQIRLGNTVYYQTVTVP